MRSWAYLHDFWLLILRNFQVLEFASKWSITFCKDRETCIAWLKIYDPLADQNFDFNYLIGGDGSIYEYNALGKTGNGATKHACTDKYITLAIFGNFGDKTTPVDQKAKVSLLRFLNNN